MKYIIKIMDKILEAGAVISVSGMIIVVLLQVFARVFLPQAPAWTEEGARFLFIFSVAFAAGLAVRDKAFVNVDTFTNLLPKKVALLLSIVIDLILVCFMGIILYQAIDYIKLGSIQTSPILLLPMSIPYSSVFIVALFIGIYTLIQMFQTIKELTGGGGQ